MKNRHITEITAVTKVFPEGQKCIAAVLTYDKDLRADSVHPEAFEVQERTVVSARVYRSVTEVNSADGYTDLGGAAGDGRYVVLTLSGRDKGAVLYLPGEPFDKKSGYLKKAEVLVRQTKDLEAVDGFIVPAGDWDHETRVWNLLVDRFVRGSFEGLSYNLYIPENYDPLQRYPLVQFIHDASVCGKQTALPLAQGVGAIAWMTPKAQAAHPCFVLVPKFDLPAIVDDDWNVDHRLEVEKKLLDFIVSQYSIDPERLYTTGQSMGCMSSMVLNLRYPSLFAASFFVAGQWDEQMFRGAGLEKQHFWFLCSEGDAKAFPGMNQILWVLEGEGAEVAREVWRTDWSQQEYEKHTKSLISSGANMIYTPYDITSVANGWHSNGGEHHVNTWRSAYDIDAIHDWLFAQHR